MYFAPGRNIYIYMYIAWLMGEVGCFIPSVHAYDDSASLCVARVKQQYSSSKQVRYPPEINVKKGK